MSDILDLSKIEANRLEVEEAMIDFDGLLHELLASHAITAGQADLDFYADVTHRVPTRFYSDALRLRQILGNLVANAIKFTAEGSVGVRADVEGPPGAERLRVTVEDTGIGMSEAQAARIFEAFIQADLSTTRRFGGTGLGLAISRQLAELLGGTLRVQSELGKGSCFILELPLRRAETPLDTTGLPERVVCALPEGRMRAALADKLTALGVEMVDPDAAVPPAQRDDLWIVSDADTRELPLAQSTLRARESLIPSVAHGPGRLIRFPLFARRLVRLLRKQSISGEVGPQTTAMLSREAGLRVLVAEDNRVNQVLVRRLLERMGHDVRIVSDGREAVDVVAEERFDFVLMDLQMPVMDGLTAARAIRERGDHNDLPIWALTAHAQRSDQVACLDAGMNGWMTKPIDRSELQRVLTEAAEALVRREPEPEHA